jgi:phosphotransferase system enzyme I (PtsP)
VREVCDRHDVPVSLCGEMGGKPLQAMALLGLGFRRFSVPSAAIGPVKRMLRSVHTQRLESAVREALDKPAADIRVELENIANRQGIKL